MSDQQTEQALGKYTILRELGHGGFATVYLAQDNVLRRSIALKILHPLLLADPAFVRRFEQEAHATAQLDHPHIATIYELGQLEGRLYIAIQLLPGGTLADRIRQRGPLPFAEAARVVGEIAEALDHAHTAGFVHRDVKPTNILFNARDEAVLTDFGMVKAVESSVIARSTMGNVIGTPAYIAPEVWEGKDDGPGTDVYALGCVLFEMLTGELLFKGNTPPAVMLAHFQRHQYPARWPEGVPPQIEALLERALSRDLADRHVSAGALAADLAVRYADPLAEPYAALRAALTAQEWERASQMAQEIMARDPDYRDTRRLAQQAAETQARANHLAQWRDTALAAEGTGEIDAAQVAARRWLEMAPGDAEAQALLGRLDAAKERTQGTVEPAGAGQQRRAKSVVADRQETEPGTAAPASAEQQWHAESVVADRQETEPDVKPLVPADKRNRAPGKRIWWPTSLIAIGWIFGWIISVTIASISDSYNASIIGWAIGWAIAGTITGLALRRIEPSSGSQHVLILAIGWSCSLTIGLLVSALSGSRESPLAFSLPISVILAGLITGMALRRIGYSITSGKMLFFATTWGISWTVSSITFKRGDPWVHIIEKLVARDSIYIAFKYYSDTVTIMNLAVGGIISAIAGSMVLLWIFSQARRSRIRDA